jgi:hypothetical protein
VQSSFLKNHGNGKKKRESVREDVLHASGALRQCPIFRRDWMSHVLFHKYPCFFKETFLRDEHPKVKRFTPEETAHFRPEA